MLARDTSMTSTARFKFVSDCNLKSTEGIKSGPEIFDMFSSFKAICHAVC